MSTMENCAYRLTLLQRYFSKRRINRVVEVRAQDIDDYSADLSRRGVSQRSRAAYLSTIRVFFQWLQERGKLLVNPTRDVVIPTRNEEPLPEPPLTEAEMASILDGMPRRSVSDLRNWLHLELLYGCGLRLTESIKLKVADVDMEHRSLRIAGKGGKVRVLPLMKGTLGALKDYLALRRSLLKGPDDGTLLIGKTTGKALSETMLPAILRRVTKRAGFKCRLHAHLFRHSIAVHLLQRGADMDRQAIVAEIQRVAKERGVSVLSWSEFASASKVKRDIIYKRFEGWREACQAAGLESNQQNVRLEDDDLFENMRTVFIKTNGICNSMKFARLSGYDRKTYQKRFGKWQNTLQRFRSWLTEKGIPFPYMATLPATSKELTTTENAESDVVETSNESQQWERGTGLLYGDILNFRGLQHAPLNEQGVVLLFGMTCRELGFVIEAVRPGFPDCIGKRRVKGGWQAVRIEFEFSSSNFKTHGHNHTECDLIVCWNHDWKACPLEVLELKSAIQKLSNTMIQ